MTANTKPHESTFSSAGDTPGRVKAGSNLILAIASPAMAGPGKPGRRHKGHRTLVQTRLPRSEADFVTALADERGEYRADLVAALLRVALEHLDELPEPADSDDDAAQGRFDLAQAS